MYNIYQDKLWRTSQPYYWLSDAYEVLVRGECHPLLVREKKSSNTFVLPNLDYRIKYMEQTKKKFDDTKGAIRIRISKKNRQHNGQKQSTKGQTTIYKTYI